MRLPLVLGLAAVLSIASCQENKTTTDPVKVQKASDVPPKGDILLDIRKFTKNVEKVLTIETDNIIRAKRILAFVKDSRLKNVEWRKNLRKVMDKMTIPIKDQKEIFSLLDTKRVN